MAAEIHLGRTRPADAIELRRGMRETSATRAHEPHRRTPNARHIRSPAITQDGRTSDFTRRRKRVHLRQVEWRGFTYIGASLSRVRLSSKLLSRSDDPGSTGRFSPV